MLPHGIDHDQGLGLVLIQLGHAAGQLVEGDVQGTNDMPAGEVLVVAHIQDQPLLAVDQGRQLATGQAFATLAQLGDDQQHEQEDEATGQYIVVSGKFNQVGQHCAVPGR